MKGIITALMFVSLMTVVPMAQASEVYAETANRWSPAKEAAVAFVGNAGNWITTAVPAFINSIPGLAKEGYIFACDYAKENPGKTIAAAAAALIVARAAYVIAYNISAPIFIFFTDPPIVHFPPKKRFIPRSWLAKWKKNDSSDSWCSSECVEIRNKR